MGASPSVPSCSPALALRSCLGTLTPGLEEGDRGASRWSRYCGFRTDGEGNLSTNQAQTE